ncbi:hypothetical protein, partial [Phaeovulum sp.]|uniref:hypothetical protein n=1 Tax=Phaeovulum sp. TaxID=2934796 RepID=UPI0039E42A95
NRANVDVRFIPFKLCLCHITGASAWGAGKGPMESSGVSYCFGRAKSSLLRIVRGLERRASAPG